MFTLHPPPQPPAVLTHRSRQPAGPGPHPAVVMLHGRSGDENAIWVFARTVPRDWLIVAPRGLRPDPEGGHAWLPRKRDEGPPLSALGEAASALLQFIHDLPRLRQAEPAHIYLMGFSQGAATAYAAALREPGRIRGIAGLAGFLPDEAEAGLGESPLEGMPIFMAVGRQDALIPLELARRSAQALRGLGATLDYHEYDTTHKTNIHGIRDLTGWWREREIADY